MMKSTLQALVFLMAFCASASAAQAKTYAVSLSDDPAALAAAAEAFAEEIADFRAIENRDPRLLADMVPLDHGRALLFAQVCGSTFFGRAGCLGSVFVMETGVTLRVFVESGLFMTNSLTVALEESTIGWPEIHLSRGPVWGWSMADGFYTRLR